MARITVTSTAGGRAGVDDLATKMATVAADTDVVASLTAPAKVAAATLTNAVVVDIDLATITNLNKLKVALAAIYDQVVQSGKITN